MNPKQENAPGQNSTPMQSPNTNQSTPKSKSIILPIILMTWPLALIFLLFITVIVINLLSPNMPLNEDGLFADVSPAATIANVLSFLIGAIALVFGPISFIAGIILLIVQKSK